MIKAWIAFWVSLSSVFYPHSILAASAQAVRTVYSSTNVGTSNWVVLFSSLQNTVSSVAIFDSSGKTLELGICAANASANSEVRQLLIPPGGGEFKVQIPMNQRISIRAVSGAATAGENDTTILY